MVGRTGGADHAPTAHHGELNRGAADASGGAVDEQRATAPGAELVERARGRLDDGRQRGSARKIERRRDRRIVRQHRQLGLGCPAADKPNTRSPTATSATPSPSSSTTPAASWPTVCGSSGLPVPLNLAVTRRVGRRWLVYLYEAPLTGGGRGPPPGAKHTST